ncbi:hypothetical protein [Rhodococcus artemisiae]|uniref:Mce-associated membrane protein n=1 Tax=Rhodococcus artemisiae TaxID=714159 RepID=A0ABU7LLN0_9NOCA|nr:hypothetical protein [Rhodococcus artemisiae]MEE2061812.1 hypothetical protein [Rhodococcus artemisiae]
MRTTYKTLLLTTAMLGLIGAVIAVVILTRTSSPTPQTGTDSHIGEGDPLSPVGSAPETVATNAMSIVFSWKPATDKSGWDALHRAGDLLTGELAAAAATPPATSPRPVSEWDSWARSGDVVSASTTVSAGRNTTISGSASSVPVDISQTVLHPDGDMTPYTKMTATVELVNVDGTWLVETYRIDTTQ